MRTFGTRLWMRTDNTAGASMISFALAQLSAENPIDENRVAENDRQHHQRAHQHEDMGCGRRGRLPNRQRRWNDIGEIRDQESEIAQQEKSDGCEERQRLASALDRAPCRECDERGDRRDPPQKQYIWEREPS